MTTDVCIAGVLASIKTLLYIVKNAVMAISVPALVQTHNTTVQYVVEGLSLATETLFVVHFAP